MKKKVLLIDRDGTIIKEPPITFQVDELSQLELLPGVIRNLYKICNETDYEIVMVTNQDGLGTDNLRMKASNLLKFILTNHMNTSNCQRVNLALAC
jgi:imidazoleglycerol-phosphate dehydratase/histidinol-phosphatase